MLMRTSGGNVEWEDSIRENNRERNSKGKQYLPVYKLILAMLLLSDNTAHTQM